MPRTHVSFSSREHSTDGNESEDNERTPRATVPILQTSFMSDRGHFGDTPDEQTSLLSARSTSRRYGDGGYGGAVSRSRELSRVNSRSESLHISRPSSRYLSAGSPNLNRRPGGLRTPRTPKFPGPVTGQALKEELVWYDQFTSTDWVRDSIADGYRVLELRKAKGLRGRLNLIYDAAQGWILVSVIGGLVALCAYFVDVLEGPISDWKRGYCSTHWLYSEGMCCQASLSCREWRTWANILGISGGAETIVNCIGFTIGCMILAGLSCYLTLWTKTVIPSQIASTFDEDLGAETRKDKSSEEFAGEHPTMKAQFRDIPPPMTYYSAAGSGVAEVKVILSGFVLHGYLGMKTLVIKTLGLILSVSSGMSLGKEGPYVHIATCIGNIACRMFKKYNLNDAKRREVLSASAASGVAVAFGSPLGGVLFSLEEVSYYFPPKTLFRTFFCCIFAALLLKFLNPYGTNQIVLFEVRYVTDWRVFELACFAFVGVVGGLMGALFIKASRLWAITFRRLQVIKKWPMLEVLLVAMMTGLISYWNRYANLPVTELLFELASPCKTGNRTGLCPRTPEDIPSIIRYLLVALVIKSFLTVITFGIKIPAGIYVPSMVVGGLMGRMIGHGLQYAVINTHSSWITGHCPATGHLEDCITPGVYALVAAGATMCGVTRLSVTLAVILFELTGSLDHVLPFSLAVLFAKWTADFVEPQSIYDLLINMNSYPFMDNRMVPVFDSQLGDITPRPRSNRIINVSFSSYVQASELRSKLNTLQNAGELDGGLPIIRDGVLVGIIPVPDLEFALDRLEHPEDDTWCLMVTDSHGRQGHHLLSPDFSDESDGESTAIMNGIPSRRSEHRMHRADITPYIDPAPVALDVHSPMDLVYQCFSKLGLRYICVIEGGEYRGTVHKKILVKYIRDHEAELEGH